MKVKILSIILLLAMLVVPLTACNTGGEGNTPTEPNGPGGSLIPEDHTAIVAENATKYTIVYPNKAGDVVKAQAERLSSEIEKTTGVQIPVENDLGSSKGAEYEIRVGRVSRTDALKTYDGYAKFGDRDFAIEQVGNHIYLYGTTAQSVVSAMEYFLNKVVTLKYDYVGIPTSFSQIYEEGQVEAIVLGEIEEKYVNFTADGGTIAEFHLRLSYTGNKGWRIQTKNSVSDFYQDMGASQRLAVSLGELAPLDVYPLTVTNENGIVTVTVTDDASAGKAVIDLNDFKMDFYSENGALSASIDNITSNMGGSSITGKFLDAKEAVYGTGERFNAVNQRGKKIHMFSQDIWSQSNACYMVVPMLCFSRGSGIFLNIYEEMDLNLGLGLKNAWNASIIGAKLDCYVFTTEKMEESIYGYTELSGHAGEVEEWTYGMLICRYGPDLSQKWTANISARTQDGDYRRMGVYDCIALMEEYDLPWTGILAEGWGAYNSAKHADLKELCDYVHSQGKKFLVYMRVGSAGTSQANFKNKYLLTMTYPGGRVTEMLPTAESNNPDTGGENKSYPYLDITNPEAVEWFFGEYWDYLANDIGVDGCKIDFCETLPEYYTLNYYDNSMPTSGSHHWYPSAFCAMYWEMISSKPDGGMCYTRGGGIGAQRAPYMWAGDQARRYDAIAWQLTACLSSGMSGVPYMSYDMSGYQYGSNYDNVNVRDPKFEGQVFVRGLQYSAFTICMQQHGKVRNAFNFAVGEIQMLRVRKESGKYTTSWIKGDDVWSHWTAVTTGGFNANTGYYTGINPKTGYLYEWVINEDGSIKTADVYVIDPNAKEKTYTLESCKKDKDGNVIESYTKVRTVKVTDGNFDAKTGFYKGFDPKTEKLESDGIRYVYVIQPGSMTYITDIYRGYVKLHDHLAPYLSELTAEASATGMPVMRILTLGRQDDENTYSIKDEYMFGEAFLVAPVLDDTYSRNIYLPEGRWKDLNTGDEYVVSGGTCTKNGETLTPDAKAPATNGKGFWLMNYSATLAQLPVFYNLDCESETAAGLLPGIREIFDQLNRIPLPAV